MYKKSILKFISNRINSNQKNIYRLNLTDEKNRRMKLKKI
jgi:hypothetical protein